MPDNITPLGKAIKTARTQKKMTQRDVVFKIGIGDFSVISKWENDTSIPAPSNLIKLAQALELPYSEQMHWMGLAGYIPMTIMPNKQQIMDELDIYCDFIGQEFLAAGVVDYRFHIWAENRASLSIWGYEQTVDFMAGGGTAFEQIMDQAISGLVAESIEPVQKKFIAFFRLMNLQRQHEPFFSTYPECMQVRLGNNYKKFEQMWHEVMALEMKELIQFSRSPIPSVYFVDGEKHVVNLRLDIQITYHFPQFAIFRFIPVEIPRTLLYEPDDSIPPVVKLWDVARNIDGLIDRINVENGSET